MRSLSWGASSYFLASTNTLDRTLKKTKAQMVLCRTPPLVAFSPTLSVAPQSEQNRQGCERKSSSITWAVLGHRKWSEMKIDSEQFRVSPGELKLSERPTSVKPFYQSKKEYQAILKQHVAESSELQQLHYASNRYALLLIFQGMDSAGKDGAIRHVMSGVDPAGCEVSSFKQPSAQELQHDFLWRSTCRLPERGRIGIFNRSYYEEVLVVRVHPEILRSQGLPEELINEKNIWEERYRSIVEMESHLYRNATRTIKFFLHLSKAGAEKAISRSH